MNHDVWGNSTTADSLGSPGMLYAMVIVALLFASLWFVGLASKWGAKFFAAQSRISKFLQRAARLFGYGLTGVAAVGVLVTPAYAVTLIPQETHGVIFKWAGVVVLGVVAVTGFGWVVEKWWLRVKENRFKAKVGKEFPGVSEVA